MISIPCVTIEELKLKKKFLVLILIQFCFIMLNLILLILEFVFNIFYVYLNVYEVISLHYLYN